MPSGKEKGRGIQIPVCRDEGWNIKSEYKIGIYSGITDMKRIKMREYLLLLPIIFIFHDMEEIIGFGWFFRNNPEISKRLLHIITYMKSSHSNFTKTGI